MKRAASWAVLLAVLNGCSWLFPGIKREEERKEALTPNRPAAVTEPLVTVPIRVRVYVGKGYAALRPDWDEDIERQFEDANELLAPFGARFEVEAPRVWSYQGGERLEIDLARLESIDEGRVADYVVGFVGALPRFSDSIRDLGMARVLGRHAVVRAIDDTAEFDALRESFELSSREEIDSLYLQRRRHKQAVILIHEWAHTIGALHELGSEDYYMQPAYDARRSRFSPRNQRRLDLALSYRVGADGDELAWRRALAAELERVPGGAENADLLTLLRTGPENRADRWKTLTVKEKRTLQGIFQLYNAANYEAAWKRLAPLRERHRDLGPIQTFACQTSLRANREDATTVCGLAVLVARDDPLPALELLAANSARPALDDAEVGLVKTACERSGGLQSHLAGFGAQVLMRYGAYACAQDLVGTAALESRETLLNEIDEGRARLGIPPASEDPELEVRWWQDDRRIGRRILSNDLKAARTLAARAKEAYPSFSGPFAALCEAHARGRRYRSARPHCEAALERYERDARALYVLSVLDLHQQRYEKAVAQLERAIDARQSFEEAWKLLGQTLRQMKRGDELDALRARYRSTLKRQPAF